MFTGLIQGLGKVVRWDGAQLTVDLPYKSLQKGESIAVEGACLTVAAARGSRALFDVGPETRRVTTLGSLKPGRPVNVERALRWGDAIGGHCVTGHVDGVGTIAGLERDGRNWWLTVRVPAALTRQLTAKGSVTIDGISLTVVSIKGSLLKVMIIPHTYAHTTLCTKSVGDSVNLETDVMAKYATAPKRTAAAAFLKRLLRAPR
jgi:riboflavin synthase